jgi:hypothetical protein
MFVVSVLIEKQKISLRGLETELKMSWAEGMIGVMPIFDTYEHALAYIGDRNLEIFEMKEV